jgi:hypothetical protein
MVDSNIKKAKVLQNKLPTIRSSDESYDVRYRIISEDKNRQSHWSPIFNVQPEYAYISGNISISSSTLTTVAWDPVTVEIGNIAITKAKDYDVWVKWSKANGNGDWINSERISGTSMVLVHPSTFYYNGINQAEAPTRVTVEIYLKGEPISRSSSNLLVYSPAIHTI